MLKKASIYSLKSPIEVLVEICSLEFLQKVVTYVENGSKRVWYGVTLVLRYAT